MNRLTIFKTISVLLLLSAGTSVCLSQETIRNSKHSFQFSMGGNINMTKYQTGNLADNMTKRHNGDFSCFLRYTFFPLKHWGIYAEMQNAYLSYDFRKENFMKELQDLYYIPTKNFRSENSGATFYFGITYREETKRFIFLPHIGFGSAAQTQNSVYLLLKGINNNDIYSININNKNSNQGFRSPSITTGFSIQYKVAKYIYLTADVSYAQMLKRPISIYDKNDLYSGQTTEQKIQTSSHLGKSLTISSGICIPIYSRNYNK